jgi:hypothetical protein
MKTGRQRLTLDRFMVYEIRVPGQLDEGWSDWDGRWTVTVDRDGDGQPFTRLTGTVDQAALLSTLRRLYALGLPLISVVCLDCSTQSSDRNSSHG